MTPTEAIHGSRFCNVIVRWLCTAECSEPGKFALPGYTPVTVSLFDDSQILRRGLSFLRLINPDIGDSLHKITVLGDHLHLKMVIDSRIILVLIQKPQPPVRDIIQGADDHIALGTSDGGNATAPLPGPADKDKLVVRQPGSEQRPGFRATFGHLPGAKVGGQGKVVNLAP